MAKNQVTSGAPDTVLWTNNTGSAVAAGAAVVLGATSSKKARVGVLLGRDVAQAGDVADGAQGVVAITECFELPKVSGAVIAQGESVNWDASNNACEDNAATPAAGDVAEFGMAHAAAGSGATTVQVWLDTPGTLS